MANTINTRIILRNDTLSAWNQSQKKLLKGEMALALHTEDGKYKNKYEIRIGEGDKTFSQLSPTNLVIPYTAISGIPAAAEYALSVSEGGLSACLTKDGVQAGAVFSVKKLSDDFDNRITSLRNDLIQYSTKLRDDLNSLSINAGAAKDILSNAITGISSEVTEISNEISAPVIGLSAKVTSISTDIYAASTGLSAKQIAISNDIYTAGTGLSAKVSSNTSNIGDLSTALTAPTTGLCARVDALESSAARGVNFVGHVTAIADGDNATYTLSGETSAKPAAAGNLVIKDGVEYIFSDKSKKWEQFGDEGNTATTAYVDNKILSVTNTYKSGTAISDIPLTGNVVGDVAIISSAIGSSTGKYQYTAYYWNGTAWAAMDGNYDAENVYFSTDITLAGDYDKVGNVKLSDGTLNAAGKSVKTLMDNIFTKELYPKATLPTASVTTTTTLTGEVGSGYTVPSATLKFTGVGSYTYGPATDISCPAGSAVISCIDEGTSNTNGSALVANGTVVLAAGTANAKTFTDSAVTYNFKGKLTYSDGVVPKTNLGNDYAAAQIKSGTLTPSATCKATGYRKRFWYVGTDDTTAIDSAFLRSTAGGHGSDFSTTTKTKDLTVPAGTKRVVFAYKGSATLKSVIDVDGMGLDIKDKFTTTSNVSVEGANGYTAASYTVFSFVNSNGVTATTFKITLN